MGTSFHVPRSDNLHQKQSVLPPDLKDKRSQALWDGVYIKIDQPGNGQKFSLKYLELVLVTLSLITLIGTK